jgi:hypothetical protein
VTGGGWIGDDVDQIGCSDFDGSRNANLELDQARENLIRPCRCWDGELLEWLRRCFGGSVLYIDFDIQHFGRGRHNGFRAA